MQLPWELFFHFTAGPVQIYYRSFLSHFTVPMINICRDPWSAIWCAFPSPHRRLAVPQHRLHPFLHAFDAVFGQFFLLVYISRAEPLLIVLLSSPGKKRSSITTAQKDKSKPFGWLTPPRRNFSSSILTVFFLVKIAALPSLLGLSDVANPAIRFQRA